jgi:Flp pilus assembly protein TadB
VSKTPAANDGTSQGTVLNGEVIGEIATGKGRPTPTRAEREAANRRPLVANTKEAKARARAELRERQDRARLGMANGEEKFLPARDKGPQKRFARDYTDAGWHLGEFLMPAMVVVIIATFIPMQFFQYWSFVALWIFIFVVVGDMIILSTTVKRKAAAKFGKDKLEKGLGWYAAMRSVQMRFMRLPKAQVKRGQYPA